MTTPSTVSLNGIVVLSSQPGWLLDYTVDTPDPNNQWASIARIVNATGPLQFIIFETPVNISKFRISSTRAGRDFSRINEIYPIFAVNNVPAANITTTASSSVIITIRKSDTPLSITPSSDNLCNSSCRTSTTSTFSGKISEHAALASSAPTYSATSTNSPQTAAPAAIIASGVFGGLVAILLIALVTLLLIRRKRKVGATARGGKGDTGPGDLSNAINAASPMTTRSYHPPHAVSAPAPVAYSTSPRPENMDISSWTGEISNGVNASMSAVLTGPPQPSLPRELDGGFPSSEMG